MENYRNFSAKKIVFNKKKIFGENFPKLRRKSSWHKFVAQVHGNEPRTFTMEIDHGNVPWKLTMVIHHGKLPWKITMKNNHGKLPWKITMVNYHGKFPW